MKPWGSPPGGLDVAGSHPRSIPGERLGEAASAACGRAAGKVGIRFSVGDAVGDDPNKKINACVLNALGPRFGCLRLRQSIAKINKLGHQSSIALQPNAISAVDVLFG